MLKLLASLAVISLTAAASLAQTGATVLHCGTLLDEPGSPPRTECTVIIEDGKITNVIDGYLFIDAAPGSEPNRHIDLMDKYVLPGLIDCHTHLTFELPPMSLRLRRTLTEDPTHEAIDGTINARKTLMAGFTTVRNVGSGGAAIYALRGRINSGAIPGPRILAAGKSVSVTGGHADPTNGINPRLSPALTASEGVADGADEMRKAVRERVKQGSDLIKITATGGVLSNTAAGVDQQMFEDELEAVVNTARMMGRKVAAHAHGTDGINAALRAGVHSIEHGTYLDESSIELFNETGAYLVPTIHAGKFVAEKSSDPAWFNPAIQPKAAAVGPVIQGAFGRAYEAGVNIAFGTDVGVGAHGTNALEFVYMTEAGMPADEAIKSATINAADLCGIGDTVGKLKPGFEADLIAVDGDPTEDITLLQNVTFVMKSGEVFKHEKTVQD
ncbi:MAG: amidohydrolase family protein [Phycisphaera sp.]|nr:MAG: amidohydrolase family protein [Phycisphaera sp.]